MTIKDYRVTAEFQSKAPHTTCWLVISYHTEAGPVQLLADLIFAGWKDDGTMKGVPPMANGRTEKYLFKPGTGLFRGWTEEEQKTHLNAAKRVLRRHRVRATRRRMTAADMM